MFRERLNSDKVKDMFAKHKFNLKKIFKEYAADDDTGEAALASDTMNAIELASYCRDLKLIGPLFSEKTTKTLFAYVQQQEELLDAVGDDDENTEIDNSEMVYLEFTECHGAIGSFQRPDPYNVLDMRLDSFISEDVVPPCRAMVRFRGKGLKEIPKPEELA